MWRNLICKTIGFVKKYKYICTKYVSAKIREQRMNIGVFCAASDGVSEAFKQEARIIGLFIAAGGHTLVYGGATGGLMTAVA